MANDLLELKDIRPGNLYLVESAEEEDSRAVNHEYALQLFAALVLKNKCGLAITRKPLDEKAFEGVRKYWLVDPVTATDDARIPLNSLERIIRAVTDSTGETPVILGGMESLESYNGFDSVYRAINKLHDLAIEKKCVILLLVNPKSFTELNYNRLKALATPRKPNIEIS